MEISEILTLFLIFGLIGVVVAGWLKKRRVNVKTNTIEEQIGIKRCCRNNRS